ncbi:MAG: CapA family protein [Gemmatimonadetes bacterium]|nr:CapA family protein [Gemmatimonadota bacterium]
MERRKFVDTVSRAAAGMGAASLLPEDLWAIPRSLTLTALGDLILTRKVRDHRDDRFDALVELLRSADCTWGNCEMNIFDARKGWPMGKGRDGSVICEPWGAEELAWMGIDFLGMANNHTADYGEEGLLGTLENLERAGLAYAGSGRDLQFAARPGYFDSPGGRVGQISCASTFPSWSLAAYTTPHANGRPGLNPLRVNRTYQVRAELFEQLKRVDEAVGEATGREPGAPAPVRDLTFLGNRFVPGATNDELTEPWPQDLKRITDAVAVARRNARVVIVTIHAHERYKVREVPARFLETFARACIDAGADAFFGTGPHVLRGLELYKGKPIFYSLGNFIFQYETVKEIGAEELEANNLDVNTLDPSLAFDNFRFERDSVFWETVVPFITYEDGPTVAEIKLYPVVMGQNEPRHYRGTPILATPEEGSRIVERLARLSQPYGTSIAFENGVGVVRLK